MKWKGAIVAMIAAGLHTGALAQATTKIVIGAAPGAGLDGITRAISEPLGKVMNRTFIIENRPGASGNIAAEQVAKAKPDGNTVLIIYNAHPVAGSLFPNLAFDPVQDFSAVGMVASTPYILVAHPSVPGDNLNEFVERTQKERRSPSFGTAGLGTPQHLMLERLKKQTGLDINMVHYKSSTQAQTDVIGSHVDFTLSTVAFASPQIQAGKLKALAVTSEQRLPAFPDVPTVSEAGYDGFVTDGWYAMVLPANTPQDIVDSYNAALNEVLALPSIKEQFAGLGLTPQPGTPAVLDDVIRNDAQTWAVVIKDLGIEQQ